jgi:hypothetical protein
MASMPVQRRVSKGKTRRREPAGIVEALKSVRRR